MEVETIEIEKGYPLQVVTQEVTSYRPIRNNGDYLYSDALVYLARTLPPNEPSLNIIFGLASFSLNAGGLTDKQTKLAEKFINYWTEKGVL